LRSTLTASDLDCDTSEARSLINVGYCRIVNSAANCTTGGVNLALDSPPADLNYVPSNPALLQWNFHNTYFVTIKKAKLQSIGFLDANGNPVTGWTVEPNATTLHNSPAKVCQGTPLVPATGGAAIAADTGAPGPCTPA